MISKGKVAKRGVSDLVKKIYKFYITSREANIENTIKLRMNLLGNKLCTVLGTYAVSDDRNVWLNENFS